MRSPCVVAMLAILPAQTFASATHRGDPAVAVFALWTSRLAGRSSALCPCSPQARRGLASRSSRSSRLAWRRLSSLSSSMHGPGGSSSRLRTGSPQRCHDLRCEPRPLLSAFISDIMPMVMATYVPFANRCSCCWCSARAAVRRLQLGSRHHGARDCLIRRPSSCCSPRRAVLSGVHPPGQGMALSQLSGARLRLHHPVCRAQQPRSAGAPIAQGRLSLAFGMAASPARPSTG